MGDDNKSLLDTALVVPAAKETDTARYSGVIGTTHTRIAIPSAWKGRRVDIRVWGGNVSVLIGGPSVEASYNTRSTVNTEAIVDTPKVAPPVFDGTADDRFIEKDAAITHMSLHGSTPGILCWITLSDLADASPTHSHTS